MKQQRGIALVLVLWVVMLLAVIAGAMSMTQRTGALMTANIRLEREARALVDAGIAFMMLQLQTGQEQQDTPWPMDGHLRPWQFAGRTIWIGAIPESGRVDLNRAHDDLLLGVIRAAGVGDEQARAIRDAIIDWRDRDNMVTGLGAEDSDYRSAGRPIGARDELFLSVEELQQVQGVSAQLYKKLRPALTVDSRQRTVNPLYAPPLVLHALPGLDGGLLEQFLEQRQQAGITDALELPLGGGNFISKSKGIIYRMMAEVDLPGGGVVQGEAIVNTRKKMPHGYQVLRRDYGDIWHLGRVGAETGLQEN